MRFTEIDGERYEVKDCAHCPFSVMSDAGGGEYCLHPKSGQDPRTPLDIDNGFAKSCPLRDVQDQYLSMDEIINKMFKVQKGKGIIHEVKPCPFCGSTDVREIYYDDEGDILEEWMMEEANKDGCDYKSWQEYLDANGYAFLVGCEECGGSITSKDNMKDAWEKWNRRV